MRSLTLSLSRYIAPLLSFFPSSTRILLFREVSASKQFLFTFSLQLLPRSFFQLWLHLAQTGNLSRDENEKLFSRKQ